MGKYTCQECGRTYDIEQSGTYECECGKRFDYDVVNVDAPAVQFQQAKQNKKETISCPFCGGEIGIKAKKCMHCGEWVHGKPKSKAVYIILTLLFGHLGVGEFYIKNYFFGSIILAISLLMIFTQNYWFCGALWLGTIICACFSENKSLL